MRRWVAPAVAGGLLVWTALATPLSVAIGEYFAYYDPQSDPERLEYHRDLAAHVYTAGHWFGQFVAAFAGAWVVTRSGSYRRAALAGLLLGLGTGAVAIAAGVGAMRTHGYPSVAPDPTMLSVPSVRWCLLASLACFPLWAVIGAAIARMTRGGAPLAITATFLVVPATSHPVAIWLIATYSRAAPLMPALLLVLATVLVAVSRRARPH
ncbi:hypothetical protein [Actinoplanes ianthinogenes]|nr:hypothetical protein [Actinoplanes ianthinogenes]